MLETDENITKQSRSKSRVDSCSSQAPCALGAITLRIRSRVSEASRRVVDHHGQVEHAFKRSTGANESPR